MTIFSAALLLFLIMDPIGNIPLFLSSLNNVDPRRRRRIVIRELLIALVVLLMFLFGGRHILDLLGIAEHSLTVAGGIILFLIALKMIFPAQNRYANQELEGEPFIVPLASPFIAGPSAMASVMLIMSRDASRWMDWTLSLLLAWLATAVILFAASSLSRHLGKRGLVAIERLMGMVLTTIAVQMMMNGIREFLGNGG